MLLENIYIIGITHNDRHLLLSYFYGTGHRFGPVSWCLSIAKWNLIQGACSEKWWARLVCNHDHLIINAGLSFLFSATKFAGFCAEKMVLADLLDKNGCTEKQNFCEMAEMYLFQFWVI